MQPAFAAQITKHLYMIDEMRTKKFFLMDEDEEDDDEVTEVEDDETADDDLDDSEAKPDPFAPEEEGI
jgi:hypothetical protein